MLMFAFWLITPAVAIGAFLAFRAFGGNIPPKGLAALHGVVAVAGLVILAVATVAGRAGADRYGTASFGPAAVIIGTLAAVLGLTILGRRLRGLGGSFVVGVHATVAVTAYAFLLAYVWLV